MSRHTLRTIAVCALAAVPLPVACNDDPAEPAALVCTPLPTDCPDEAPSYANVVAPIVENNCSQCHYPGNPDGNWPLNDPIDIADWSASIQLSLADCLMPPRDSDLIMTDTDRQTLNAWIVCGAPDN